MIPEGVDASVRAGLLAPEVVVPPLLWLLSPAADTVTGKRVVANRWRAGHEGDALEDAGC
jgi:3-oxoacyl-[acyl-carrier protein] reductase